MDQNQNTGLLLRDPEQTDWIAGAETGIAYEEVNPEADWKCFLPNPEKQKGRLVETMACVSFSALNCIETQINRMISLGQIPENDLTMLKVLGFIDSAGKFNASDRFVAKMSGTTKSGNYLTSVWNAIHNFGLVAESDWPFDMQEFDWDTYYREIPTGIIEKAARIKEIFDFNYEFVFPGASIDARKTIRENIKQAPLQLAAPVCSPWGTTNLITKCGITNPGHATEIYAYDYGVDVKIFDTYDPYNKRIEWEYPMPYIMKGVVALKQPVVAPEMFSHSFGRTIKYGERSDEVVALQNALKIDGTFPLDVDSTGYYGNITRNAVRIFSKKYQVADDNELAVVDGKWVGPKTRCKLNELFNK